MTTLTALLTPPPPAAARTPTAPRRRVTKQTTIGNTVEFEQSIANAVACSDWSAVATVIACARENGLALQALQILLEVDAVQTDEKAWVICMDAVGGVGGGIVCTKHQGGDRNMSVYRH